MNRQHVRFMCRRGLLELDVILLSFFDQMFDRLDVSIQQEFMELLAEDDPVLAQCLIYAPLDEQGDLVKMIRQGHISSGI